MIDLCRICPEELNAFCASLAAELARGKSADEILMLRNAVSLVAQSLFTIATQKQYLERNCGCGNAEGATHTNDEKRP